MTNNNKKWILLLVLSVIWGSSFILIKKSLVGLTPLQVGSLRIIFTAIVISIYSYSSLKEIPKKSWKWIILTAYVGTFFPVYLVSFGQTEIESGLASIITTLTPINTLIIGIIFFSLTFTIKQVVGLVVAFFGGILLLYNGGISPNYNVYFSIFIFFISLISQLGDLIVSFFKRIVKTKDTGKILPGHGGVLDRVDGILFGIPIGFLTLILIY